jgi:hypothetical protein
MTGFCVDDKTARTNTHVVVNAHLNDFRMYE